MKTILLVLGIAFIILALIFEFADKYELCILFLWLTLFIKSIIGLKQLK